LVLPIRGARTLDNVTRRSRSSSVRSALSPAASSSTEIVSPDSTSTTVPSNCRTGPFPVDDDGNDVNDKDDDDGVTGVPTAPTSSPPPQPPPRASQMKSRFAWASRSASRNANAVSLVTEPKKRSCTRASPTLTISTAMLPLGGCSTVPSTLIPRSRAWNSTLHLAVQQAQRDEVARLQRVRVRRRQVERRRRHRRARGRQPAAPVVLVLDDTWAQDAGQRETQVRHRLEHEHAQRRPVADVFLGNDD
jgi:hypothetical protein